MDTVLSQGSALASATEASKAVPPSPPSALASLNLSDEPAAAASSGKEGKKKGGGKGGASPGLVLGKGTAVLHAYVGTAAGLSVATTESATASVLEAAWKTCRVVLEPLGQGCGKLLEEIRAVVEANQVCGCIQSMDIFTNPPHDCKSHLEQYVIAS